MSETEHNECDYNINDTLTILSESLKGIPGSKYCNDNQDKSTYITLESLEKEIKHKCELCGKKFKKTTHFHQHLMSHSTPIECDICKVTFFKPWDLKMHKKQVHFKEKLFTCTICKKEFMDNWRLTKHTRIHTNTKKHICQICNKAFTESGNLTKHLMRHKKEKPFLCEMCPKKYSQKKDLQTHMMVHTTGGFSCTKCTETFKELDEKRAHMKVMHVKLRASTNKERTLECSYCSKTFNRIWAVRRHEKLHRGGENVKCTICDRKFSQICNMKRHIQIMHTKGDKYFCLNCPSTFDDPQELKEHIITHKDELSYKCDFCSKSFSVKQSLANHIKLHRDPKKHIKVFLSKSAKDEAENINDEQEISDDDEVRIKDEIEIEETKLQ